MQKCEQSNNPNNPKPENYRLSCDKLLLCTKFSGLPPQHGLHQWIHVDVDGGLVHWILQMCKNTTKTIGIFLNVSLPMGLKGYIIVGWRLKARWILILQSANWCAASATVTLFHHIPQELADFVLGIQPLYHRGFCIRWLVWFTTGCYKVPWVGRLKLQLFRSKSNKYYKFFMDEEMCRDGSLFQ